VYEDYLDGCKELYEDVEKSDVDNGLISYCSDEFIIIEDVFVNYDE